MDANLNAPTEHDTPAQREATSNEHTHTQSPPHTQTQPPKRAEPIASAISPDAEHLTVANMENHGSSGTSAPPPRQSTHSPAASHPSATTSDA
eukprot:1232156-Prymnesium_polylepis.1